MPPGGSVILLGNKVGKGIRKTYPVHRFDRNINPQPEASEAEDISEELNAGVHEDEIAEREEADYYCA